jgi:hypothetical protein
LLGTYDDLHKTKNLAGHTNKKHFHYIITGCLARFVACAVGGVKQEEGGDAVRW